MAITLDELLGRPTQETKSTRVDFPSYEDYKQEHGSYMGGRSAEQQNAQADMRNYAEPAYSATRQAPVQNDAYGFAPYPDEAFEQDATMSRPIFSNDAYANPQRGRTQIPYNFYEFTSQDAERSSDAELYKRLSFTSQSTARPVFGPVDDVEQEEAVKQTGKRAKKRLNLKGKLIVCGYVAMILTVVALIIAGAGKINKGTAVAPTSRVEKQIERQTDVLSNNIGSIEINSDYEVGI